MNLGNEHLGPYEMAQHDDEPERVAAYCTGPGHRYEYDADGWLQVVEECPACLGGPVRNHWLWRLPEGVDLQ